MAKDRRGINLGIFSKGGIFLSERQDALPLQNSVGRERSQWPGRFPGTWNFGSYFCVAPKDVKAALEQNPRSLNAAYEKATDAVHAFATIPKEAIPRVHARATIDEVTSDEQPKVQRVIKEFQSGQEQNLKLLGEIRDELRARRDGEEDGEKAPEGSGASEPKARPKDKRKTPSPRKDEREAIFAHILCEHHGYENGEIEKYDPIPFKDLGNKFAELTGRPYGKVKGSASIFLKEHFQTDPHTRPYISYKMACKGRDRLRSVLMKLSGNGKAFGVRRDG